jgi:pimeloyl-ACP methyl ester carboxylesterase
LLRVTSAVFRHVRIEPEMHRTVTKQELASFEAPTLVLAAGKDVFFPGEAVVRRAKQVIPNVVAAEVLEGSGHMPSRKYHEYICRRIGEFLDDARSAS